MPYKKSLLIFLCSISLTSCWWSESKDNDNTNVTKKGPVSVRHISAETEFNQIIKRGNIVVDFYATWCGPCKRLGPVIDDLSQEFSDVNFIKINVDENNIANNYNVRSIPTLIFFKNGKQVKRINGYQSKKDLASTLRSIFK